MRLFPRLVNPSVTCGIRGAAALVLVLGVSACSDDPAPASAEGVSWKLTALTGGGTGSTHTPDIDNEIGLKVRCSKGQTGWDITIEDPGRDVPGQNDDGSLVVTRNRSVIRLTNVGGSICYVNVKEGAVGSSQPEYKASCGSGCSMTINEAGGGYDFRGSLICDNIIKEGGQSFKLTAADLTNPIPLNLSNCN